MEGFKKTEFSTIPSDWDVITLGDEKYKPLIVLQNGLTNSQDKEKGDFRVTRIETISNGIIDEIKTRFVSNISIENKNKYLIRKGDILFSHINSDIHLGKTAIAKVDYIDLLQGMNLLLFRVNVNIIYPDFLNFVFNYYRHLGIFIKICSRAVNQSSINQAKLKQLKIPFPILKEQKMITFVLSKIQSAIETQEKIIKITTELKKALMQKLFTEGLNGEPQRDTEIGKIPVSWEIKKVEDMYDFTKKPRGLDFKRLKKIPFIPMELIPDNNLYVRKYENRKIENLSSGTYIENGDLLIAKITPSFENGKQAIVDFEYKFGYATTEVIPVKEKNNISSKYYLFYYLLRDNVRKLLTGKMEGSTGRQR